MRCGRDLGNGRRCDGVRMCAACFAGVAVTVNLPEQIPGRLTYGAAERAVVDALLSHGPRLRGLGHVYADLDANARHYVACVAIAALEQAGWTPPEGPTMPFAIVVETRTFLIKVDDVTSDDEAVQRLRAHDSIWEWTGRDEPIAQDVQIRAPDRHDRDLYSWAFDQMADG